MIVLLTDKLIPDSECYTTNKIWNEKANLMMNDRNEEKTEMVLIIPLWNGCSFTQNRYKMIDFWNMNGMDTNIPRNENNHWM